MSTRFLNFPLNSAIFFEGRVIKENITRTKFAELACLTLLKFSRIFPNNFLTQQSISENVKLSSSRRESSPMKAIFKKFSKNFPQIFGAYSAYSARGRTTVKFYSRPRIFPQMLYVMFCKKLKISN